MNGRTKDKLSSSAFVGRALEIARNKGTSWDAAGACFPGPARWDTPEDRGYDEPEHVVQEPTPA